MIRSNDTEYVRRELPARKRSAEEIGAAIVDALARGEHLRREKTRVLEEFRREEDALGLEIGALVREQKGEPAKRHEDIACEVWYDLENGNRCLVRKDRVFHVDPVQAHAENLVDRRPMTPQEREKAERLAKEQEGS